MGYRSDVRIMTTSKGWDIIQKNAEACKQAQIMLENTTVFHKTDEYVYLGWNDEKWYDDFDEVQNIMNSLEEIAENGEDYHYVRIGEDLTDMEERSAEWSIPYVSWSRSFDDFSTIRTIDKDACVLSSDDLEYLQKYCSSHNLTMKDIMNALEKGEN